MDRMLNIVAMICAALAALGYGASWYVGKPIHGSAAFWPLIALLWQINATRLTR